VKALLHRATVASHLCLLIDTLFNRFGFFFDRPRKILIKLKMINDLADSALPAPG
jgi:hypothetical protein